MDDRFLFRGRRVDGIRKHFVTGHYVSTPRPMIVNVKARIGGGWDAEDVDPTTVGQCTGLSAAKSYRGDKPEDLLIFEGDVCLRSTYNSYCNEMLTMRIVVEWAKCGFDSALPIIADELEIIGNIHDNPELLTSCDQQRTLK